jgi:hypothetical protein
MTKLSSTDPEPPVGSVVVDCEGRRWRRFEEGRRSWAQVGDDIDDDTESWTRVAGNYGPVLLIDGTKS